MIYGPFTFAFGILTFDKLRSNSFQIECKWISIENFNECTRKKNPNCQNPWNDLNNAFGHRLEIPFWYCSGCQCGFIFQRISNLFRMWWLRLNWFPAIDLHLAQIILSYSIELANKLKQIGYLSFRQKFSTNENPNPFNIQRFMEYGERNSMQKCFDCAVWVIWVSNNIRILIEHN